MAGNGLTKTRGSQQRGFSLLEAMIALGILLVGIAGIAVSFQAVISKSVASRNQSQAAIIAQSVLAELSDTNPEDWNAADIAEGYMFDYYGDRVDSTDDAYYQISLGTPVKSTGWWNVTIGVTWSGWRYEQEKAGYGIEEETQFAYVLDAAVASFVPTTE